MIHFSINRAFILIGWLNKNMGELDQEDIVERKMMIRKIKSIHYYSTYAVSTKIIEKKTRTVSFYIFQSHLTINNEQAMEIFKSLVYVSGSKILAIL